MFKSAEYWYQSLVKTDERRDLNRENRDLNREIVGQMLEIYHKTECGVTFDMQLVQRTVLLYTFIY